MEEKAVYNTKAGTEPDPTNAVRCTGCDEIVGYYERRDGQIWLRMPDGLLIFYAGGLHKCGAEFRWSVSMKRLEILVERVQRHKREGAP